MKRRALALDHFARPRRVTASGLAVFGVALGVAALLAIWQRGIVAEIEVRELQQVQAAPRRSALDRAPIDPGRLDDAAWRAQLVALELRLPWMQLFDAVESAADPAAIALLSIEPDARRSALRISGEARHKKAMLDYMQRLGEQSPMVRAVLESHSQRAAGAAAPVQFTLMATWEQPK
jgi:Tfp pilus assembly protein PilN